MNVSSNLVTVVVAVLAVWRATHFLFAEDGPWDVSVRVRRLAGAGFFGKLLDCFYCLSVWIAAPVAWWIGNHWEERLLLWPALSAGAILLERFAEHRPLVPHPPPPALWHELPPPPAIVTSHRHQEEEQKNGMLR